jgi:hypothetical protein
VVRKEGRPVKAEDKKPIKLEKAKNQEREGEKWLKEQQQQKLPA